MVKGVEKSGEFVVFYESDIQVWKQEPNKKHYGVDKCGASSERIMF